MEKNVATFERIASVLVGGLALQQTLMSNRPTSVKSVTGAAGLAFLWRGVTGSCPIYRSLNINTHKANGISMTPNLLERSALINLPPEEVASFLQTKKTPWGRFSLAIDEYHYKIDIDGRTWMLELSGHSDGNRTLIKLTWNEQDSLVPERVLEIRKLKSLMETGEIASIEGQPHGDRGPIGSFFETFGDKLLHSLQSRTALPDSKKDNETMISHESEMRREAHA
ncbi:MAG: DUF2892 domain-containing protein [Chitinophagaceae bacterium]|nr:DUF2892 domain-containing protein [Oligoflexus sp.]